MSGCAMSADNVTWHAVKYTSIFILLTTVFLIAAYVRGGRLGGPAFLAVATVRVDGEALHYAGRPPLGPPVPPLALLLWAVARRITPSAAAVPWPACNGVSSACVWGPLQTPAGH